jgi:hypothetical protein
MRRTAIIVIAMLASVFAACGDEGAGDGQLLRYGYQPGTTLTYDMSTGVTGTLDVEGDFEPETGSLDVALDMDADAVLRYEFTEGSEPDLLDLTLTMEITGLGGTMDTQGETRNLSLDELGEELRPIEAVFTIDDQGQIVGAAVDGQPLPTELLEGLGASPTLLLTPQHFGPELPEDPVAVGDRWETESVVSRFGFEVTTRGEHRVAAEEAVGGRSTLRIESTVETTPLDLGMADLLAATAQEGEEVDQEMVDLMVEFFESLGGELRAEVAGSTSTMTTWFDPAAGVVVKFEFTQPQAADVAMQGVPEMGGDLALSARLETQTSAELRG